MKGTRRKFWFLAREAWRARFARGGPFPFSRGELSPFPPTFPVFPAGDGAGGLPAPQQAALEGDESWRAPSSLLEPGAEPFLRKRSWPMLEEMAVGSVQVREAS